MRGSLRRDLHVEVAFVHCHRAFQNPSCNRPSDLAAMSRSALDHNDDDIFRTIERRVTRKPRHIFLMSVFGSLRRSRLARHDNILQPRASTGAAFFIHDFPQTLPDDVDLLRGDFTPKIRPHSRRETYRLPLFIKDRCAVLIKDLVDKAWVITRSSIGHTERLMNKGSR